MAERALRLVCIDDGVPEETPRLLRAACASRGVEFVSVDPRGFDFSNATPLGAGDLLYRPAVSAVAMRAEQHLYSPDVASFYADPAGPFFPYTNYPLLFDRAGLPCPRSIPLLSRDRATLRRHVATLGGLPVVVKLGGGSRGIGTMRADSFATLFSLLDVLVTQGQVPSLLAYVPDAVHWRVTVVGARAVAMYRNVTDPDDFRTSASTDPRDFTADPPAAIADLAIRAVAAQRLEFGGVDILEHESGRLYLLEANFPCYFAQAETVAGIGVAAAMVDHLASNAATAGSPVPPRPAA